jgi:transposase
MKHPIRVSIKPAAAHSGHYQIKPERLKIERLRREVDKLQAERNILKKAVAYFAKEAT